MGGGLEDSDPDAAIKMLLARDDVQEIRMVYGGTVVGMLVITRFNVRPDSNNVSHMLNISDQYTVSITDFQSSFTHSLFKMVKDAKTISDVETFLRKVLVVTQGVENPSPELKQAAAALHSDVEFLTGKAKPANSYRVAATNTRPNVNAANAATAANAAAAQVKEIVQNISDAYNTEYGDAISLDNDEQVSEAIKDITTYLQSIDNPGVLAHVPTIRFHVNGVEVASLDPKSLPIAGGGRPRAKRGSGGRKASWQRTGQKTRDGRALWRNSKTRELRVRTMVVADRRTGARRARYVKP